MNGPENVTVMYVFENRAVFKAYRYYSDANDMQSPLQQHILFWDRDRDGMIFPWDTYNGFRELGFNVIFSIIATFIINVNFSYPTHMAYSWCPDPWFRVHITSIHKAKVSTCNIAAYWRRW